MYTATVKMSMSQCRVNARHHLYDNNVYNQNILKTILQRMISSDDFRFAW